ncbi:MAG TPA: glycosyltransferase family 1 protein [Xanthobacteraceae bacterium]|jgi:glycosyltransferase involved in cell wall biosynthesis|nr:glycosyltransferase family 1 protein [Xanthobacteraceae bacterium]
MKRIAIDARIIYTSTGRYVERLIEYLQQIDRAHDYTVLLRKADFDRWQPKAPNFRKLVADHQSFTFGEQIGFARQLRALSPDLVHFTVPQQPMLYRGRRVTTIHDLTAIDFINRREGGFLKRAYKTAVKPQVFRIMLRLIARDSAELITPTAFVRQQLIDRLNADPARTTYTHESAEKLAERGEPMPALSGTDFILYVGTAHLHKNLQRLADAAAGLKDIKLVLAGKPDLFYEQLQKYIADRRYTNVHYLGFVSDSQLAWLYQNAKLYVFPSLSEGFGLPGLEAMSYGVPVAAANATCLPEVYGEAAVYFDPVSVDDIRITLDRLLADPGRLAQLKQAGLAQVRQYSWRRMAEQTLAIYDRALSR